VLLVSDLNDDAGDSEPTSVALAYRHNRRPDPGRRSERRRRTTARFILPAAAGGGIVSATLPAKGWRTKTGRRWSSVPSPFALASRGPHISRGPSGCLSRLHEAPSLDGCRHPRLLQSCSRSLHTPLSWRSALTTETTDRTAPANARWRPRALAGDPRAHCSRSATTSRCVARAWVSRAEATP